MSDRNSNKVIQLWSALFFREFGRAEAAAIMALNKEQVLAICERREKEKTPFDKGLIFVPVADVNLFSRFGLIDENDRRTPCRLAEILFGPRHLGLVLDPLPGGKADIGPSPGGSALWKITALAVATMDDKMFRMANSFFVPLLLRRPPKL